MKMKKLSVVLLSLLAAVMVLSGCGGGAQDNDSAESAENGAKNRRFSSSASGQVTMTAGIRR